MRSLVNISQQNLSAIKQSKVMGYELPTVWYKFSRLAVLTNSVNLGQGFPDWQPAEILIDALKKQFNDESVSYQYSRSFGNVKLTESIANNYEHVFKRKIDPLNEIIVTTGASAVLYNCITGLVEQGDEVIILEPSYDCYLPQIQFSGGLAIGIPLIPPKIRPKSDYYNLSGNHGVKDQWQFDFEKFRNTLSSKTKLLILNTPHNPTGKVFTYEELQKISDILKQFPNVIVLMDEVYEHMIYDEYEHLPRLANLPGMWDRTISIMSAGKIFSATGIRIGWAIGPKKLIQYANAIHQFNAFCMNDHIQLAVAETLNNANKPYKGFDNYYKWLRAQYTQQRNYFVENLAKLQNFQLNFFLPEGAYFLIADISNQNPQKKYEFEGEENLNIPYRKDFNYLLNLAHENQVIGIPCSVFYTDVNKSIGENNIRFAFCKKTETLDKALVNLAKL